MSASRFRPISTLAPLLFGIGLALVGSQLSRAFGDDIAVAGKLRAAFEAGWKPSVQGLKSAVEHGEQAKGVAPSDVRVPFALALIHLQNRRYPEATRLLDEALASGKGLLPVRRVRIYLALLTKDFAAAEREMQALAEWLDADEFEGDAEQPYRESAFFLGNAIEFLSVQGAAFKREQATALDQHIRSRLKGKQLRETAYAEGRAESAGRAAALKTELSDARSDALEQDKAKKADAQAKVDAEVVEVKAAGDKIANQEQAYRTANEAQRAIHEPQAREAEREIDRLESKAKSLQNSVDRLESDIKKEERDVSKDKDKNGSKNTGQRLNQLRADLRRDEAAIDNLRAQIRQIVAGNPSVAFMRNYRDELRKFAAAQQTVGQRLAQVQLKYKGVDRIAVDDSNATSSALALKSKAVATFVTLSLDAERDRILASYQRK